MWEKGSFNNLSTSTVSSPQLPTGKNTSIRFRGGEQRMLGKIQCSPKHENDVVVVVVVLQLPRQPPSGANPHLLSAHLTRSSSLPTSAAPLSRG